MTSDAFPGPAEATIAKEYPDVLRDARRSILEASMQFLRGGSEFYAADFLFIGAANRSLALIDGFIQLHESENYLCMAPILRMHLDTLLRLHASTIAKSTNDFAMSMLAGGRINDFKDIQGRRMTDGLLRTDFIEFWAKRGRDVSWVERVYKQTSGHIHLSGAHIHSTTDPGSESETDRTVSLAISGKVHYAGAYAELADECFEAMLDVSGGIVTYLKSWSQNKWSNLSK